MPRSFQHRRRDVNTKHLPSWADFLGKQNRNVTAAAPDIHNALAGARVGSIDQEFRNRRKYDVLRLLAVDPVLAAGAVPECNLVRVQLVPGRYIHHSIGAGGF